MHFPFLLLMALMLLKMKASMSALVHKCIELSLHIPRNEILSHLYTLQIMPNWFLSGCTNLHFDQQLNS